MSNRGTKRVCQSCSAKFYDLMRSPIICPRCDTVFDPEAVLRSRRGRGNASAKPEGPAAKKGSTEEAYKLKDADDDEDEEEEDALIEDASELGEDEDDMAEVLVDDKKEEDV